MTKSQNTKNEQQKITSEQLTEQWKKGELPEGYYYVKCDWSDEIEIRYVHNGVDDWKAIVTEVPSYNEWKANEKWIKNLASLSECLQEKNIECLHSENRVKELLKECKTYIEPQIKEGVVDFGADDIRNCLIKIEEALR